MGLIKDNSLLEINDKVNTMTSKDKVNDKRRRKEQSPNATEDQKLIEEVESICREREPFKHIQELDYPRKAGSSEEGKAANYIENTFRDYGFDPSLEEFYLPTQSKVLNLLLPILFIGWGIFSFINIIFIPGILQYIFAFFVLLVPALILIALLKLEVIFKRTLTRNFKKIQDLTTQIERGTIKTPVQKGTNIFAEYIPEDYQEHLYLTAHFDSTTLKFNMKSMKVLMIIGVLSFFIYIFGYLSHYLLVIFMIMNLFAKYWPFFLVTLILFLITLGVALFSRGFRTNQSHGAVDDLTGLALILELASITKIIQPKLKITFIAFTAEEVGLFGSIYHYNTHKASFQPDKMHVVSIDMIGEIPPLTLIKKIKPALSLPMNPEFNEKMLQLAQKLGIKIKQRSFAYPGSDFASWLLNGYKVNWVINPSKFIHSPQDVGQNVNQSLLNECLRLFTAYLLEKR